MTDILATLFRFRQFLFEFGPFFLAAWIGLAVTDLPPVIGPPFKLESPVLYLSSNSNVNLSFLS